MRGIRRTWIKRWIRRRRSGGGRSEGGEGSGGRGSGEGRSGGIIYQGLGRCNGSLERDERVGRSGSILK